MGRQDKDHRSHHAVVGSSIVLLQERFRQLEKLKEMREERQLLNLLPQTTDGFSTTMSSEAAFGDPLALGLNSHGHHMACFRAMKPRQFPCDRGLFEKPDVVDTSLRL